MNRTKNTIKVAVSKLLLVAVVMPFSFAMGQVAEISDTDITVALGGRVGGLPSKAFRRTAAPDSISHACPEVASMGSQGVGSKNLVAVPFASDGAPSIDLAINFATNSDKIVESSHIVLSNLAKSLKSDSMRGVNVAVAGHTDTQGSVIVNLELSCARAISVRNYLLLQGVDAARLGVYGFGSSRPVQVGIDISAINRRVEIRRAN
jgi:outer membrane protein OmpA-like peptidoglycan-associated protein